MFNSFFFKVNNPSPPVPRFGSFDSFDSFDSCPFWNVSPMKPIAVASVSLPVVTLLGGGHIVFWLTSSLTFNLNPKTIIPIVGAHCLDYQLVNPKIILPIETFHGGRHISHCS